MSKETREQFDAATSAWQKAAAKLKKSLAAYEDAIAFYNEAKSAEEESERLAKIEPLAAKYNADFKAYKAATKALGEAGALIANPCGGEFTPRSRKVAWSEDPEKRKRQRKHIAESIAKKKAIENPPPRKLPGQAVLLGEAVELEVISDNGRRRTFKGNGDAALLSDADGDALAIVRPSKMRPMDPKSGSAEAKATWRKWSGFTVDAALLLEVTDRPLKFSLGKASVIRYRSDKWTGKALYYEHKFESKDFHVWGDSASSPRAILITAFPPRRLVTARGIVG